MFKYKEKRHLLNSECSSLQKIQHQTKCGRWQVQNSDELIYITLH